MEVLSFLAVAGGITKVVDFVRNLLAGRALPAWLWNALAFLLGLIAVFALNMELVAIPGGFLRFEPSEAVMKIVTGLALGAFASGWHELWSKWSRESKVP